MTDTDEKELPLRERLELERENAPWAQFEAHYKRGALFLVMPGVDLIDVGVAIAEDGVNEIQTWLSSGDVRKCTEEDKETLSELGGGDDNRRYEFLIVQPYVLLVFPMSS